MQKNILFWLKVKSFFTFIALGLFTIAIIIPFYQIWKANFFLAFFTLIAALLSTFFVHKKYKELNELLSCTLPTITEEEIKKLITQLDKICIEETQNIQPGVFNINNLSNINIKNLFNPQEVADKNFKKIMQVVDEKIKKILLNNTPFPEKYNSIVQEMDSKHLLSHTSNYPSYHTFINSGDKKSIQNVLSNLVSSQKTLKEIYEDLKTLHKSKKKDNPSEANLSEAYLSEIKDSYINLQSCFFEEIKNEMIKKLKSLHLPAATLTETVQKQRVFLTTSLWKCNGFIFLCVASAILLTVVVSSISWVIMKLYIKLSTSFYNNVSLALGKHFYADPIDKVLQEAVWTKTQVANPILRDVIDVEIIRPIVEKPEDKSIQRTAYKHLINIQKIPNNVQKVIFNPKRLIAIKGLGPIKRSLLEKEYFRITLISDIAMLLGVDSLQKVPTLVETSVYWGPAGTGKTYMVKKILGQLTKLPVLLIRVKQLVDNPNGQAGKNGHISALTEKWFSKPRSLPLNTILLCDDFERGINYEKDMSVLLHLFDPGTHTYLDNWLCIEMPMPFIKIGTGNTGIPTKDNYYKSDAEISKSAIADRMHFQNWRLESLEEIMYITKMSIIPSYEAIFSKLPYGKMTSEEQVWINTRMETIIKSIYEKAQGTKGYVSFRFITSQYCQVRIQILKKKYLAQHKKSLLAPKKPLIAKQNPKSESFSKLAGT